MVKEEIRLDEMELDEVNIMYKSMFGSLVPKQSYDKAYKSCKKNYEEMVKAEKDKIKPPSSMGRGWKYAKNMIYGWFVEDLFYELLKLNKNIKKIDLTGNDKEHKIIYDYETKKSIIVGAKTTVPDFLITLSNNKKMYLELKTAAKGIYSIKTGNVKQLYKTMGESQIFSCIVMLDLVNETYSIHSIEDFLNQHPFVNNRMEGQLCYDVPQPTKTFSELVKEDLSKYIKAELFNILAVKRFEYLNKVRDNKELASIISSKIKIDDLYFEFRFKEQEFNNNVKNISSKIKNIDIVKTTWEKIFERIDNEK